MIERYSLPAMKKLWELKTKYGFWLKVELAVCEALNKVGQIPEFDYIRIIERAKFDVGRIEEIENEVKHDFIAFLTCVNENLGDVSKYVHTGLTSSDVIDTALALQIREANLILFHDFTKLLGILREKALEHKETLMIGRSHGVHAEPTTLGLKFALWYDLMKRNYTRLSQSTDELYIGKISGAVGTYANIDPKIEELTCQTLELKPAKTCTQIIQRDVHARYIQTLALIASSIELIATEIRSLQRTDILEVEEFFDFNQKGSSAMPHKRNPISSENLCGLARVIRANSLVALENVTLWHERDMSHSSAERIILPDSTILLDYMLDKLSKVLEKLIIYPENMINNMNKCGGIIFSQQVLLILIEKGLSREKAYRIVQKNAHEAWNKSNGSFKDNLLKDQNVMSIITRKDLEKCFDPAYHIKNINHIYKKLEII
ncbi:MAG: adenylosuccinate lyase [Cyanobacteriota bacterium]